MPLAHSFSPLRGLALTNKKQTRRHRSWWEASFVARWLDLSIGKHSGVWMMRSSDPKRDAGSGNARLRCTDPTTRTNGIATISGRSASVASNQKSTYMPRTNILPQIRKTARHCCKKLRREFGTFVDRTNGPGRPVCIFPKSSGLTGRLSSAIDFCPWCGRELEFMEHETVVGLPPEVRQTVKRQCTVD